MLPQLLEYSRKATFLILLLASCLAGTAQAYTIADETFIESTGELYWDIGDGVRLEFICKHERRKTKRIELPFVFDFFDFMDYYPHVFEVGGCNRGLGVINMLREDRTFRNSVLAKRVELNEKALRKSEYGDRFSCPLCEENYQALYGAMSRQLKSFVYVDGGQAQLIKVANIDRAEKIKIRLREEELEVYNKDRQDDYWREYKYAMAADIAALLGICLVSIFTYKKAGYFLRRISKKIKSIFSEIRTKLGRAKKDAKIVGNDKLRSYSAADELLKWAELREKGIISEREFDEAREKILRKG